MDDLRWERRPLLVFAPTAESRQFQEQMSLLTADAAGLRERDMAVIEVVGPDRATIDGKPLPNGAAADLRRRYDVSADALTVVLVGKDGTEKLRASDGPVATERIFGLIDSMPMRRNEMRE